MSSNHQHPPSNDDRWDALLELTPVEREGFVAEDLDQAMMLEVQRGYRRSAADPAFSDRLLASLLEREVVVGAPVRMALDDGAVERSVRRPVWRSAPIWGYVTIALIVGLLAISAVYTFELSGDDADPTATELALGAEATKVDVGSGSESRLAAEIVIPSVVEPATFVLTRVTLAPGVSYASTGEGTDVAFAESGVVIDANSGSADGIASLTSPFEVTNTGTDDATFLVFTFGDSMTTVNEQVGVTLEPMSATPISGMTVQDFSSGSAVVELTQGTGSGSVATGAGSATSVFTSGSVGVVATSSGASAGFPDATPGLLLGTPVSETAFADQEVVEYVEVKSDAESPWYIVSIESVAEGNPATPVGGAGGG